MQYPFLVQHQLKKEDLKQNFYKLNYNLAGENLAYWVVLPTYVKEFNTTSVHVNPFGVQVIGEYLTQEGDFFYVEVFAEYLEYDINASDWLMRKLAKLDEEILDKTLSKDKSTGIYLDVLTLKNTVSNDQFISRFTARKNFDYSKGGANYIGVRVMCKAGDYDQLSDYVLHTSRSWDFQNKGNWQLAERLLPIDISKKNPITFYLFESWKMYFEDTDSKNHFLIQQRDNSENKGIINLFAIEADIYTSAQTILDTKLDRLKPSLITLNSLQEISKEIYNPRIDQIWVTEGEIKNEEEGFNAYVKIFIFRVQSNWYYLEGVGSNPNFENYNWEINKRQMEMIIDSFNNSNFDKIERPEILPSNIEAKITEEIEQNEFRRNSIFFD